VVTTLKFSDEKPKAKVFVIHKAAQAINIKFKTQYLNPNNRT
jgi:hypothetical protein